MTAKTRVRTARVHVCVPRPRAYSKQPASLYGCTSVYIYNLITCATIRYGQSVSDRDGVIVESIDVRVIRTFISTFQMIEGICGAIHELYSRPIVIYRAAYYVRTHVSHA